MRHWTTTPDMALTSVSQIGALFYADVAMVAWSSLWSKQTKFPVLSFVLLQPNAAILKLENSDFRVFWLDCFSAD